uniref:NADH-ubiquinone oxidoreductase chain 5 n=1 Tax=Annulohypoxylon stygium TaxID=326628 RepID=A0A386RW34_9PEZI|nr:NADH dehydrogenase subunit 5 [Annulohypoxylon stygium]
MYLSIIFLPLLGSIVSGFFGRKVGVRGAQLITCSNVIVTTILAMLAFFEVGFNNIPVSIELFRWIDSEWLNIVWGFEFDSLTVSMLIPVLIISSLVHVYSISYMSNDPFFSYLSLFTFMMIILVTGNNYLLMFVGWEGVGVCSYLLVSFWFTRIAANQSSLSAFLTNRVGDCFLTIGMFAILWCLGKLDYATVFSVAPYINENVITIIGICLLIGAMAKSSQVGLHVWLPMAIEGPTPVSALIHAATMVTAGVYLLIRSSPLIEYSSVVLLLTLWLGAITTVFSSLVGLFQQDIKKVIAYSTMSQLGMMVIAIGLSSYNLALFHLVNHAFYKGLLFLGAGAVIHAVGDNQDFRRYGGLIKYLPLTYSIMLIASLSLVAFPFMTGFYSKDFILESAFGQYYFSSIAVYVIAVIGAMFTTLYSVKVLYLTFLTSPNGSRNLYEVRSFFGKPEVTLRILPNFLVTPGKPMGGQISVNPKAHEGDIFLSLPLVILAIFSVFFGYLTKDIFIGLGSSFFIDNSIFIHPVHEIMLDTEFAVPVLFKLLPLVFTISLSVLAIIFSEFLPESLIIFKFSKLGYNIFGFFNQRFLVEMFYNKYVTNLVLNLGGQTTKVLDKGSIELLGPFGLELGFIKLSKNIASLSTGIVTSYALYILMGFVVYLLITYLTLLNFDIVLIFILTLISWGVVNFYSVTLPRLRSSHPLLKVCCGEAAAAAVGNLNYKALESNFFFSLYFFYYKLKDIFLRYRHYLLLVYLLILLINLLNQYINPELPNLYIIEDNKTSGSSNAVNYSNVDNSSNKVESSTARYEYKGVADSIHKQIAEIDKNLNELKSNSADFEKEKKALLEVRDSLTDQMTLVNDFKSTRSSGSYIPQSSDNKRMGDFSSTVASSSKRSRD